MRNFGLSFYTVEKTDDPALGGFQPLGRPRFAVGASRDSNSSWTQRPLGTFLPSGEVDAFRARGLVRVKKDQAIIQSARRGSPPRSRPDLRDGEATVSSFIRDPREFAALCFVGAMLSAIGCTLFFLVFMAFELFDFG